MQKIYLIIWALGMMMCTGCNKFLDEKPVNELTPEQYWKNEEDIIHAMAGMYDGLQSSLSSNYVYWGESRTDNLSVSGYGNKQYGLNGLSATIPGTDWAPLYTIIGRANTILKYAPNVKNVTAVNQQQYKAQCLAMRAFSYFWLVRVWGDAPVWLEPYESLSDSPYRTRTGADSILTGVIIPDLQKAYDLLNTDHSSVYMINKGSVAAMLADVFMWRHDYDKALEWMDKLTALKWYSLEPTGTWKNMFVAPSASLECIWSLPWDYLVDGGAGMSALLGANDNNSDFLVEDTVWNHFLQDTTDIRGKQSIDLKATAQDKVLKFVPLRLDKDGKQVYPKTTEANFQYTLYRLTDILLLRAEALTAKGNLPGALALLNQIHTRAGMQPFPATAFPDAASMLNGILRERQLEFFCECKRWFDLRRTGKVKEVMDPLLKSRQPENPGYNHPGLLLWPINRNNLNANPFLKQNPPYAE